MTRPTDTGSRTEADAAAFERHYAEPADYDGPSASDLADDAIAELPVGECSACGEHGPLMDDLCRGCWEPPTCPGCGETAGHRGRCR